jgi:hypothetical protein
MEQATIHELPIRITDLIRLKENGANITCQTVFEVVPVDFSHRDHPFKAYIFLCRFSGAVDGVSYAFRKCYARGCPHNLCPHVSRAVMIANRYLQRDYERLKQGSITIEEKLFTLEGMLVQFADSREESGPILTIDDVVDAARAGSPVSVDIALEYVAATEHFEYGKNHQTFLMGDFTVTSSGKEHLCQRCLACYPTDKETEERQRVIRVANDRLAALYERFDETSIVYGKRFFE